MLTLQEFDEKTIEDPLILTPAQFDKTTSKSTPILSPEEFDKEIIKPATILSLEEFDKTPPTPAKPQMQKAPWMARHPNLYAAGKTIAGEIPFAKFIDPEERRDYESYEVGIESPFVMTEQPDIPNKHLIDEELKLVAYLVAGPAFKYGAKPAFHFAMAKAEWLANKTVPKLPGLRKWLPKTYEAARKWLTKPRSVRGKQAILDSEVASEAVPAVVAPKPGPVEKFMAVREKHKSLRKEQDILYSQERAKRFKKAEEVGKRIPGEAGYHAQLKELKGPLPGVRAEYLKNDITQADTNELFNIIRRSEAVTGANNITAERGLAKLLGEKPGYILQPSEEKELVKIFGEDFIKVMQEKGAWDAIKVGAVDVLNIPRAVMSSYDVSAPFRQGLFLINHPKRFFSNFKPMFKSLVSEKAWLASQKEIAERPTYELMKNSRLAIMELGKRLSTREEKFLSQFAEYIPGVRASGRAYTTFLNRLRADVFDDLIKKADKLGLEASINDKLAEQIAHFVNVASGRGKLGALEKVANELNAALFSPRLMASRLTLLNPVYYIKADPFVRKEALKSLFTVSAMTTTILTLAAAGGADVELDPRSSDFLKIKIGGKTRVDILGGVQQYMRAAGQIISGKYISSTTGKEYTLGEGYRPLTRLEIAYRFAESKASPIASFAIALMKGQDITGEKVKVSKEVGKRFVPMVIQDVYDLAVEDPELLPLAALGAFGVGIQTYGPRRRATRGGFAPIGGIGTIKGLE